MRAVRVTRACLFIVTLCAACGDEGAATTTSATSGSNGSIGTTGTTSTTTGVITTGDVVDTTTGAPTTSDSATTGVLTGSESSGTSTGADTTSGTSTTGIVDTTGDGSTSTGEGTSTGDESTSTGDESSSTGATDTDTGGESAIDGYLGMSGSNTLVRFDTESAMVLPPAKNLLPHAGYPYDMEIKPDGSEVWVVGASGNGVKIADTATGQITHDIDLTGVGKYPVDVVFNVAGTLAYVSARDSKVLVVIDAATYTVKSTISLGIHDGGKMTFDP